MAAVLAEVIVWGSVAAVALRSWLALGAAPILLTSLALAAGATFPLRAISPSVVAAARRSAVIQFFLGLVVVTCAITILR